MYGQLVPVGGGDPIPLLQKKLTVGRRESCDIVLRFANVSGKHCELAVDDGYWFVKDLGSRNGTKVNGLRITKRKRLDPGDTITIAKQKYEVKYSPIDDLDAVGTPPPEHEPVRDMLSEGLLERAGLKKRRM